MAYTFDEAFYKKFSDSVYMNIEAIGDVFGGKATMEDIGGEVTFFDTLGSVYATAATGGDSEATPLMQPAHDKRALAQVDNHAAVRIGKFDEAKALVDFKSKYVKRLAEAIDRKRDIQFIKGALGTATTGKDLGGTAAFDFVNQTIDVATGAGGATGMNVAKLRAIKAKFWKSGYSSSHKMYVALTGEQIADLLAEQEVGSADYNTIRALVNGEVDQFMGIEIVQCERLPFALNAGGVNLNWDASDQPIDVDANKTRACFAWIEDTMVYGKNPSMTTRVSERDDLSYAWQAYIMEGCGSVRLEENGVQYVPCLEV